MCTTAAPSRGWSLMSEPSVYTHSSGENFGVHGVGRGGAPTIVGSCYCGGFPVGSAGASSRLGSGWENVYVFSQGNPGCALVGEVGASAVFAVASASVQCRMLRSVHFPRICMRWSGDSPSAAVSPFVKPMRTSLTSGGGEVRVPSLSRRPVVGAVDDPSRGGGVGRVPKRGSAVWGVPVVEEASLGGVCHSPIPATARMSSTVSRGSARLA